MDTPRYSIILPAFNEESRIGASLETILAYMDQRDWSAEVIVVNDGSRDGTAQIVREHAMKCSSLRMLDNPGNRGKGYSVRNGMLHARGEILLFSDADLSAPITEAHKLIAAIEGGADVAIGSRWLKSELQVQRQSLHRQLFGRIFNVALRLVLGLGFKDTQCGFKAFTRNAAQVLFPLQRIERWGFDPELLYLAKEAGLSVSEVPVIWSHREGTQLHPLRDGCRMFVDVLKIRWNSLKGKYSARRAVPNPL